MVSESAGINRIGIEIESILRRKFSPFVYDDNIMRESQKNVDAEGVFKSSNYGIIFGQNCQDKPSALRKEYRRLGVKVCQRKLL